MYSPAKEYDLVGYTDSDWTGYIEARKSTSRYVFNLNNGNTSWSSKKQLVIVLSTIEVEYIAAAHASWRMLEDLNHHQNLPTTIIRDNKPTMTLAKTPVFKVEVSTMIFLTTT